MPFARHYELCGYYREKVRCESHWSYISFIWTFIYLLIPLFIYNNRVLQIKQVQLMTLWSVAIWLEPCIGRFSPTSVLRVQYPTKMIDFNPCEKYKNSPKSCHELFRFIDIHLNEEINEIGDVLHGQSKQPTSDKRLSFSLDLFSYHHYRVFQWQTSLKCISDLRDSKLYYKSLDKHKTSNQKETKRHKNKYINDAVG